MVGISLAGAGLGFAIAPGQAAALAPIIEPQNGIYIGLDFNHADTVALANSPIPGMLNQPLLSAGAEIDPASRYWYPDRTAIWGRFSDLVDEAALTPNGSVGLALVDPAQFRGYNIIVAQTLN
ncbi:hypothetical protein ACWCW7_17645 [Nocardia tengchongensis]